MTTTYGCHNRAPITTVCAPTCQYTLTALGQKDSRCAGCCERKQIEPPQPGRIMSDAIAGAALKELKHQYAMRNAFGCIPTPISSGAPTQ